MTVRISNDTREPAVVEMVGRRQLALALEFFEDEFSKPEVFQAFCELAKCADEITRRVRRRELALAAAQWMDSSEEEPCAR